MTNEARGTSKRALRNGLLNWLDAQLDEFVPWSYELYMDFMYDQGIAPLSRSEFTWWMWRYNQVGSFFPWEVKKRTYQRDGQSATYYYWQHQGGEQDESSR